MPEIIATENSAAIRFDFGEYFVVDHAGQVVKEWSVWGDEYIPASQHEEEMRRLEDEIGQVGEDEYQAGIDQGYIDGYDVAMSKLYELLADIPEAVKILDEN